MPAFAIVYRNKFDKKLAVETYWEEIEVLMINLLRVTKFLMGSLTGIGLSTSAVYAQDAGANAQGAAAQQPRGWFKVCEVNKQTNKETCAVNIQILNEKNAPIAQARVVEQKGAPAKLFTVIVPPGLLIQSGLRLQIDGKNLGTAKYQICTARACIAEARFDKKLITAMKRGQNLQIIGIGQDRKPAGFPVSLSGFTAAYDGPSADPSKFLAAQEDTVQEKLRKATEARKKQLEENN